MIRLCGGGEGIDVHDETEWVSDGQTDRQTIASSRRED